MNDETQIERGAKGKPESRIFEVSLRGWITLLIVVTVCAMSVTEREVKEPLYTMVGLVLGFYFGQRDNKKNQSNL